MAQVRIEAFIKDIQENLYRGSEFVKYSVSHDQYVDDYAVHVPQAGSGVTIEKNRTQLPAQVKERADDTLTYNLDEYTTDPILIRNIEKVQLSYDKRMSIMKDKINLINQQIGDDTAYKWLAGVTTAGLFYTSGGSAGTKRAITAFPSIFAGAATGVRYAFALEDILLLKGKLDRDNVPQTGRHLLIPSDMWYDLITANVAILGSSLYAPDDKLVMDGSVARIYGFNIWQRPVVGMFSSAGAINAVGAAGAATDCLGALAWQEDVVAKAEGATKFFAAEDKPEYYGSIYSALVMYASTLLRSDAKGVAALVQKYAAS